MNMDDPKASARPEDKFKKNASEIDKIMEGTSST
jgi:hypothetical protein